MSFIGIDFGTSNSLASLVVNDAVKFVKFPDGNISNPTIIYFPLRSQTYYIGNEGVSNYLSQLEEKQGGGRLMLSIKTLLPEENFDYTTVVGFGRQAAEDLVAKFLSVLKEYAEQQFRAEFDGVVLGRPVHFNELAISRLKKAAHMAGFKEVVFWLEPVAAALAYEVSSTEDELVCVVDIGGGTSDVCVVETSPARSHLADRLNDIKSVNGINEAGDELSSQIMRHRLASCFGAGSTFESLGRELPFPAHIIYKLSKWHRITLLKATDVSIIASILPSSNRPDDVARLLDLIKNNYGFELFQALDAAKKQLSTENSSVIEFKNLDLREKLRLDEFEDLIAPVVEKINQSVFDALTAASVRPDDIKRVILTGGTSQVPLIGRSVAEIFGEEKILRPDFFSSVASGLGYAASKINQRK